MKLIFNIEVVVFIFSFLFSCSSFGYQSPRYVKLAHEITEKTAKKLKEQRGLSLVGTGGQMMHDVQMMMMGFNFYEAVDITTARQLLVDSVEEYLSVINSNDEIKSYLHNYPFTAQNVEIVIYFYNSGGSNVPSDKISIASANQGEIIYYIDYPEKYTIKPIHKESYQDALKAIHFISS